MSLSTKHWVLNLISATLIIAGRKEPLRTRVDSFAGIYLRKQTSPLSMIQKLNVLKMISTIDRGSA